MAEGGENLTGVDQEAGAKPKKGRGRGLSKTNTSLVDPEIRKIEQEELCSSKASEKSTAHQNLGTARVEKESTTNEELLKTQQSIEKRLEKLELMHNQSNELSPPNTQFDGRGRAFRRGHSYNRGNNRDSSVESVLTEQSENGQQGVIVCSGLLSMKNAGRNKRVNVKVCNISASAIKILPKTNLCQVSQVRVMDTWNPETPTTDKTKDEKPLTDLGVKVNTDNLSTEHSKEVYGVLEKWRGLFSTSPTDLGRTDVVKHEIHLTTDVPFREPYRRIPPGMVEEVNPLAESCVIEKSMKLKSEEVDETLQKLSNIDWRDEQGKDKVISRVKDLLNGGVKPSGNNLQQESEPVSSNIESTEKMPRPEQKESQRNQIFQNQNPVMKELSLEKGKGFNNNNVGIANTGNNGTKEV
uniref:Uncharacterized protein n=1 Tax=Magallana gigas TaxID=29159 RepID=A0A8W8L6X5_MAGGI